MKSFKTIIIISSVSLLAIYLFMNTMEQEQEPMYLSSFSLENLEGEIKNIDEYISFARKHLKSAWIQILSNGKALNSIIGKKIIDAGVNEIFINLYNDDLKAELPKNIKKFEEEVLHKLFTEDQIFNGQFKEYLIRRKPEGKFIYYNISRRLLNEVLTSRGGTAPNKKTNKL